MTNEEWLQWRRKGVGATDACVIMGVSPWRTMHELWQDKVFGNAEQLENSAMSRGKELEPVARSWFEKTMNVTVFPQNRVHKEKEWIRASLDGIDMQEKVLVEIKCPNRQDHFVALNDMIPEKYMPQVQHQLLVTGLPGMYYCSFDGSEGKIVEVARDDAYIQTMLEEERKFWDMVLKKEAPPLTERDFVSMKDNQAWMDAEILWHKTKQMLEIAEAQEKEIRGTMIALAGDRNAQGNGVKISKTMCPGAIDYKQIMADYPHINWESYRKKSFVKWTFRDTSEKE
jgi:putative phage-type endonuclease